MGNKAYKVIQYGVEDPDTHGTRVVPTARWLGNAPVPADIEPKFVEENIGVRVKSSRSVVYQKQVKSLPLTLDDSYYQGILMMLAMTIAGGITPVLGKTGQGDYTWDFTPGITSADVPEPDSLTLAIADDKRTYQIGYLMGRSIKFAAAMGQNQAVKVSVDAFGDYILPDVSGAIDTSLLIPVVTPIMANNSRFYADSTWAGVGTTNLDGILRSWELEIIGGAVPDFGGNSIFPTKHHMTYLDWKLVLSLEDNDDASDFYDWFRAQTGAALRISVPGPVIGTGDPHNLQFDLWGKPSVVEPMGGESEGDYLAPITFESQYDATGEATLGVLVTTDTDDFATLSGGS